jgi:hypothetical protein
VFSVGAEVFGVMEYGLLEYAVRAVYMGRGEDSRCRFEARSTPATEASTSFASGAIVVGVGA